MAIGDILLIPLRAGLAVFLFVVSPVTALLSYFFNLTVTVFQLPVWLVQKLEVIYIYLGIAVLAGISLGLIFSFVSSTIFSAFNLDGSAPPPPQRVSRKRLTPASSTSTTEGESHLPVVQHPSFISSSQRDGKGWFTSGRSGMGMGAVDISPLSPTSISPGLGTADLGRPRIFPILEEEDEHEDEVRGRKGRNKKRY